MPPNRGGCLNGCAGWQRACSHWVWHIPASMKSLLPVESLLPLQGGFGAPFDHFKNRAWKLGTSGYGPGGKILRRIRPMAVGRFYVFCGRSIQFLSLFYMLPLALTNKSVLLAPSVCQVLLPWSSPTLRVIWLAGTLM